jgi:hypothetical protein
MKNIHLEEEASIIDLRLPTYFFSFKRAGWKSFLFVKPPLFHYAFFHSQESVRYNL